MLVTAASYRPAAAQGFLVLEGVNGGGKTTLQRALDETLQARGIKTVLTRQPGGTRLGVNIREMLLAENAGKVEPRAELLMFMADRAQHVESVIRPALDSGQVVLCDRYELSSLAFQGYGRGLNLKLITELNSVATAGLQPDLTLLLDLDPLAGLKRARKRQSAEPEAGRDAFEESDLQFQQRVREGFLALADSAPYPCVLLDASQPPKAVLTQALPLVESWLKVIGRQ